MQISRVSTRDTPRKSALPMLTPSRWFDFTDIRPAIFELKSDPKMPEITDL